MSKKNNFKLIKFLLISMFLLEFTACNIEDNIKNEISNFFGPLTKEADTEIKKAFEKIKNYIQANQILISTPEKEFLSEKSSPNDHKDGIICRGCLKLYGSIQSLLLKKYGWSVLFEFVSLLCSLGLNKEVCDRYIHAYGEIVVESLIEHYLNAEFLCTFTYMCRYKHFVKLNADDYARQILADKPTQNYNFSKINTDAPVWKVLHVADIHVDLQYQVGSRGLCPYQLCCRKESKKESLIFMENTRPFTYNNTLAGRYGFVGLCDIPLSTLENFAEEVFLRIKPDFIIWTGDNPGHDAYDQSAFEVAKIFTEIIKVKYNYTLPVYPSLGNHENYPADEYNPFNSTQETEFLSPYGKLFKDWIGEQGYQDFIKFGAYSKVHPGSNLRIISTNCMLCDALNFYLIRNPTDPQTQIDWMEKVLRKAEKDGEVVYLVSHIPPGDVSLLSECAKRQKALIDRFSHIIRGQFYGHTHFDELKVMTTYFDKSQAASISYIAPSLTTVFDVDSDTKWVRDYTQYHLNVTRANEEDHAEWEEFYKASKLLNVTYLNETQKIYEYTQLITHNNDVYRNLLRVFFTDGPLYKEYAFLKKMPQYLSCRFNLDVFHDYFKCIGYRTWDSEEYAYELLDFITGSWYERKQDSNFTLFNL